MAMDWTDEVVERVRKMWVIEGLSASQIAGRIGGVTRNAVLSIIHRRKLGLQPRKSGQRPSSVRKPQTKPAAERRGPLRSPSRVEACFSAEPPPKNEPDLVIPLAERKTIETLVESSCRWPFGDPQHADFHFCGKEKVKGLPYCEFHVRRAFQPPQPARRSKPVGAPAKHKVTA